MESLSFMIGIDIGQKKDPTAIAVTEEVWEFDAYEPRYEVRFLQTLPLGTPYPDVARRLEEVVRNTRIAARNAFFEREDHVDVDIRLETYVDATGVGQPVVDLLVQDGINVHACYFTHGDRRNEENGRITIGKAWLVSRMQALLQTGMLRLPSQLPDSATLVRELLDYEIRVDQNANDKYGAFQVGTHDDLVTAVGLSVQKATSSLRPPSLAWHRYWASQ